MAVVDLGKVLAIDPGSLGWGYAVAESDEKIECFGFGDLRKEKYDERFSRMVRSLDGVWERFDIHQIAIEKPVRFRGMRISALEVAYMSALNWARSKVKKDQIFSYHPATWRAGVTGKSNASKEYVGRIVYLHFPNLAPGISDHITDALAILLYHFAKRRMEKLIEGGT